MSILIFFIILSILIFVHEFGHFLAAKRNNVLVEEFGFGLPPRIFGIKIGETLYSLNLLPIGGFVKVYGEEFHEENKKTSTDKKFLKDKAFIYKPTWVKVLILTGGVLGNFILGWVLISYLFTQGIPTPANKVIVENIQTNSPAATSGLKPQDTIYAIKYKNQTFPVKSTSDLMKLTKRFEGNQIVVFVERGNEKKEFTVLARKNPPSGQGSLGVVITSFVEKKYPFYTAPFYGLIEAFNITYAIARELVNILVQLVTFQKPQIDVTGPIGIAKFTTEAVKFGKNAVLELMALLSLNLAVVNILPFPALDGGRLVFVAYEAITKKRPNRNFEKYLNFIGIIILLSLAVLISIRDIMRFYR